MWVRPPPALQNLGEVHSEVFVFRYDISPDMEARRLYPVTLLPGRYPRGTGTPSGEQVPPLGYKL
jgi:hypothetical protein